MYIYDSDPVQQAQRRMTFHHGNMNDRTLQCLQYLLHHVQNPYYVTLLTARERIQNHEDISLQLKTIDAPHRDQRRYNRPTASEVAVILPDTGHDRINPREIILKTRHGALQQISELHSGYLPLRYPLLFPYGEQGWHANLVNNFMDEKYVHFRFYLLTFQCNYEMFPNGFLWLSFSYSR